MRSSPYRSYRPRPRRMSDEDCQDEDLSCDDEEVETITLTFRDEVLQIHEEMEFEVAPSDGLRFQWWVNTHGFCRA